MIDRDTGTIRFDDGTAIEASLTLTAFPTSPLSLDAQPDHTGQGPWSGFRLKPRLMDTVFFASQVKFRGDALEIVSLWRADPAAKDQSWDDWSMEKEVAAQKANEAWLARSLGPPHQSIPPASGDYLDRQEYRFAWGRITSGFAPQSAETYLVVTYEKAQT